MSTNTREALAAVREALQLANDMERNSPICDTIWMPGGRETLFDFIDAALATQPAQPVAKMAPVQGWPAGIPWSLHLEAYAEYCKRHGAQPALIDLEGRNCRGGFGVRELDSLIPGWRDRCGEIADLKAEVARLNALLAAAPRPAQPSAPIDAFELYAELRDLVAEAGAVDTLIGRPEVLRSRLADLCKRVGQLTTDLPLGTAQPSATCEWTNCPRRVGDVCCNEKAAQPSAPPAAYTVSGKPLVWSHTYDDQWLDEDYGFSIMLERDSETPYYAAWGEGDSEDFATLEEAKAWCQAEIDRWVRRSVVVTPAQPSALGAAHAVPNELTTKQIEEIAFAVLRSHNDDRLWRALTYESGPYDVTKATLALQDLASAFFRAGLASAPAAPAQAVPLTDEQSIQITRLRDEAEALRKDAQKSERRAITFGDIMAEHILAMRAAVVAGHLESPAHGLQWIVNTLAGPGHLPDLDEARSLGGAQALFDKEMAEHDAFRAAHPVPEAAIAATKEQQAMR